MGTAARGRAAGGFNVDAPAPALLMEAAIVDVFDTVERPMVLAAVRTDGVGLVVIDDATVVWDADRL